MLHVWNPCILVDSSTIMQGNWQAAGFEQASDGSKQMTEIMPHPASGDADDREAYASPVQQMMVQPSANLVGGPDFDPEPEVLDHGATREVGIQVGPGWTPLQSFTSLK